MSGARSFLSLLFCTPLKKNNPIGGFTIGFFLCRINWNHIFCGKLSIHLAQGTQRDKQIKGNSWRGGGRHDREG